MEQEARTQAMGQEDSPGVLSSIPWWVWGIVGFVGISAIQGAYEAWKDPEKSRKEAVWASSRIARQRDMNKWIDRTFR